MMNLIFILFNILQSNIDFEDITKFEKLALANFMNDYEYRAAVAKLSLNTQLSNKDKIESINSIELFDASIYESYFFKKLKQKVFTFSIYLVKPIGSSSNYYKIIEQNGSFRRLNGFEYSFNRKGKFINKEVNDSITFPELTISNSSEFMEGLELLIKLKSWHGRPDKINIIENHPVFGENSVDGNCKLEYENREGQLEIILGKYSIDSKGRFSFDCVTK